MKIVKSLNGDKIIYLVRTKNDKTIYRAKTQQEAEDYISPKEKKKKKNGKK